MSDFIPFQKIFTSTSEWKCSHKELAYLSNKVEFGAFEKVNGANLPVACRGSKVLYGKRKGYLKPSDWFYNYQAIQDITTTKTLGLKQACLASGYWPYMQDIILVGELCGGWYPEDPDNWQGPIHGNRIDSNRACIVPQEDRAVQEGIYYSPNIEFIAFSLLIINDSHTSTGIKKLQGTHYDVFAHLCQQQGIHYLQPRTRGSLQACLDPEQTPPVFDSMLGVTHFGQKALPPGTNVAEGIVIQPMDGDITLSSTFAASGPMIHALVRPMIKIKQYKEVSGKFDMPDITTGMLLSQMVVPTRLAAVLSKYGKCDSVDDEATVIQLLADDVWEDYWMWFPDNAVKHYAESDKILLAKCSALVKQHSRNTHSP
jgi:Rnl2 family RNA ligase